MKIVLMVAVAMAFVAPQEPSRPTYLNGEPVALTLAQPSGKDKLAAIGPWRLGAKVGAEKPRDGRLNLYIVVPGDDFQSAEEALSLYDHNRVINLAPKETAAAEYDVYWAVALEPHLNRDFHAESELLDAAQQRFLPGDLFTLSDAPGAGFLREVLGISSLDDLKRFRRKDGTLPLLVIVPAGFVVRGALQP
jgi:hypothetical protein